jgi:hypothetical protein
MQSDYTAQKRCPKCNQFKPVAEFTRDSSRADGLDPYCRACRAAYRRSPAGQAVEARRKRTAKRKRAQARYRASPEGRAAHKKYDQSPKGRETQARRRIRDREKVAARKAIAAEVRAGRIPRASALRCEACKGPAVEYHHASYAPEDRLKVVALCVFCHRVADGLADPVEL